MNIEVSMINRREQPSCKAVLVIVFMLLCFPLLSISFFDEGIDFKTLTFKDVESIIKQGADINERQQSTTLTVLMKAAYYTNDPKIIDLLIRKGAKVRDVTYDGCTALMWSSYVNTSDYVSYALIKAGSDVNARDIYGITPIMLSSYYNTNVEVTKLLLQYGADITVKDNYFERTPLSWAAGNNENPKVLEELIVHGAKVNETDRYFTSPIMRAARHNKNPEVVSILLNNGANVNASIPNCTFSYFDVELEFIFPQWIKNIRKQNTMLEVYNVTGMTALMFAACDNDNSDVIKLLINNKTNINQSDNNGNTALMFAAWNNKNPEVISTIMGSGANTKLKNKSGMTALDLVDYDNNVNVRSSDVYFRLQKETKKKRD